MYIIIFFRLQSSNLSKPVENKNAEDLDEIKTGIASLNLKTDEYKKNFHDFQKFMIYLYNENKVSTQRSVVL